MTRAGPHRHHGPVDASGPLAGTAEVPTAEVPTAAPVGHVVTTLERGAFVYASCAACGWDGPGRRARSSAEHDAGRHRLS